MIVCARQLVEKSREHKTKTYILFVDLRKAYDSVPHQALWQVLLEYGIPPVVVNLLRSLHDGMKAEVTVDGSVTPEIEVQNGLCQGCTIASLVVRSWQCAVQTRWQAGGRKN